MFVIIIIIKHLLFIELGFLGIGVSKIRELLSRKT